MNKRGESYILFEDLYLKFTNKTMLSESTIFTGIPLDQKLDQMYTIFKESEYFEDFLNESSKYNKNKVIQEFIEGQLLSAIYSEVKDSLLKENGNLSFQQTYLIENTEKQFNVKYVGNYIDLYENEYYSKYLIEENLISGVIGAFSIGKLLTMITTFPLTFLPLGAYITLRMFLPLRTTYKYDKLLQKNLGAIGVALFGLSNNKSIKSKLIAEFDNIDMNNDLERNLKRLINGSSTTVNTKKNTQDVLTSLIKTCINTNTIDKALDGTDVKKNPAYDPRQLSSVQVVIRSIIGKQDEIKTDMIKFRKCLIDKLVDLYKFLLIANLRNQSNSKKLMMDLKKINSSSYKTDPASLVNFLPENDALDKEIKLKIVTIIEIRKNYSEMISEMLKSNYSPDTEAGKYFTQRLKQADNDIETYLRNHKFEDNEAVLNEDGRDFEKRDMKYNNRPEKEFKKSYFLDK